PVAGMAAGAHDTLAFGADLDGRRSTAAPRLRRHRGCPIRSRATGPGRARWRRWGASRRRGRRRRRFFDRPRFTAAPGNTVDLGWHRLFRSIAPPSSALPCRAGSSIGLGKSLAVPAILSGSGASRLDAIVLEKRARQSIWLALGQQRSPRVRAAKRQDAR